jgi:hypothetical protein
MRGTMHNFRFEILYAGICPQISNKKIDNEGMDLGQDTV